MKFYELKFLEGLCKMCNCVGCGIGFGNGKIVGKGYKG